MSNRIPPVVRLTEEQVRTAIRLGRHFADYGKPDKLEPLEANVCGVLGEFATSLYLFGSIEPVVEHRMQSLKGAVQTGRVLDGGSDFADYRIDVKSHFDVCGRGWRSLNLLVPGWQAKPSTCYVSAVLVESPTGRLEDVREVVLAGHTDGCGLQPGKGRFECWQVASNASLWPMESLDLSDWA